MSDSQSTPYLKRCIRLNGDYVGLVGQRARHNPGIVCGWGANATHNPTLSAECVQINTRATSAGPLAEGVKGGLLLRFEAQELPPYSAWLFHVYGHGGPTLCGSWANLVLDLLLKVSIGGVTNSRLIREGGYAENETLRKFPVRLEGIMDMGKYTDHVIPPQDRARFKQLIREGWNWQKALMEVRRLEAHFNPSSPEFGHMVTFVDYSSNLVVQSLPIDPPANDLILALICIFEPLVWYLIGAGILVTALLESSKIQSRSLYISKIHIL